MSGGGGSGEGTPGSAKGAAMREVNFIDDGRDHYAGRLKTPPRQVRPAIAPHAAHALAPARG